MKEEMNGCMFDVAANGYITLSRSVARLLIEQIGEYDAELLYARLLIKANYGETWVHQGILLHRGEIIITQQELHELTKWNKTKIYSVLRTLKKRNLLESVEGGIPGHYRLSMYEEHCGRAVRAEERQDTPSASDNQTETSFTQFFGYYHFTTHLPEKEKERARQEWKKLSRAEREEAMHNVPRYKKATQKDEHLKLACNYLKDKSFKF